MSPPSRIHRLALLLVLAVVSTAATPRPGHPGQPGKVKPSLLARARQEGKVRVIVGLDRTTPDEMLAALPSGSHRDEQPFETIPFLAMEATEEALVAFETLPGVVAVQEDRLLRPLLAQSTGIVGATDAWADGYTGQGWTIAILDTGVSKKHPFLAGKVVSEACYSLNGSCPNGGNHMNSGGGDACPYAPLECWHGTHVAGIAAGSGTSFSGVAKGASILSVQIFSRLTGAECVSAGAGETPCALAYTSDIIKGLEHVYDLRSTLDIAAVNLSLGGTAYTSTAECDADNVPMKAAIDNLRAAGIATVAAAGNDGYSDRLSVPGCISSAISVGATDKSDAVPSWSNSASFLSLLAPGVSITSSIPGGGFATASGTSMAAPHVAGAWAIRKQSAPGATVSEVLDALTLGGTPITYYRNGQVVKPRLYIPGALVVCPASADPPSGNPPLQVAFSATGSGGVDPFTYSWDYADGSPHDTGSSADHLFALPGLYPVRLDGQDSRGVSCSTTIAVTVNGPRITNVRRVSSPFRLVVTGASFQPGAVVSIGGSPAPGTVYKSPTRAVATKGAALSAMVPVGVPVIIRVTNPDGISSSDYSFTR